MCWQTGHGLVLKHVGLTCAQDTPVRIVAVSSRGHQFQRRNLEFGDLHYERRPYSQWGAYGASKTANLLFAKQLAK